MADNRGYLGAEDGHLGDWAPHRTTCKCRECQHDKLLEKVAKLEADLAAAKARIERLTQLLSVSEDYRRAYQKEKYELYAMGGEICDAAAEHLPMSEGPLDRACRDALIAARAERKA